MARISTALPCSNPDCRIPRQHKTDCDKPTDVASETKEVCTGCLPGQAADGIRLCSVCCRRLGENAITAGVLHTDLEPQLRRSGHGEQTSGSKDRSPIPNEAVMDARWAIAYALAGLVDLMTYERGFTAPVVHGVVRKFPTRLSEVEMRDRKGDAGFAGLDRTSSEVEVMASYVARHAEWFAGHSDAGKHAKVLHDVTHGKVWGLAYPSTSTVKTLGVCPVQVPKGMDDRGNVIEGPCGERLEWDPNESVLIYCSACRTNETMQWWQRLFYGSSAIVDTVAAASWLSLEYPQAAVEGKIRPSVLANWASRGHLPRLMTVPTTPGEEPKAVRDTRPPFRQLYRLDDVRACAEKMLAKRKVSA